MDFELRVERKGNFVTIEALAGENLIARYEVEIKDSQGILIAIQDLSAILRQFEGRVSKWLLNMSVPQGGL